MSEAHSLSSMLAREIDCLKQLHAILKTEHEALTGADVETLERVTSAKNAAMSEQAELAAQRASYLAERGQPDSDMGTLEHIQSLANNQAMLERADELSELARDCQHYNRENGRIILQRQHQAQGALDILRHNQNDQSGPTYSVKGLTDSSDDSRTLGKA